MDYNENASSAIDAFDDYIDFHDNNQTEFDFNKTDLVKPIYLPILPKREYCAEVLFRMLDFLNTSKQKQIPSHSNSIPEL